MKYVLIVTIALLGTACGSKAPKQTPAEPAQDNKVPWFCQVGATNDDWECVQSETLGRNPKPDRLPKSRTQTPDVIDVPAQPSPPAGFEEPAPLEVKPPAPPPPPPAANNTSSRPPPPANPTSLPTDIPKHIALSYRPAQPVAILDLPAEFSAVQLVALSSKEALEAYAKKYQIRGMSAARIWNGKQLYYVLLLGIYETVANAKEAMASLTAPFDELSPWIRSVGSLQKAMLEADRQAGTSDI